MNKLSVWMEQQIQIAKKNVQKLCTFILQSILNMFLFYLEDKKKWITSNHDIFFVVCAYFCSTAHTNWIRYTNYSLVCVRFSVFFFHFVSQQTNKCAKFDRKSVNEWAFSHAIQSACAHRSFFLRFHFLIKYFVNKFDEGKLISWRRRCNEGWMSMFNQWESVNIIMPPAIW